MKTLYFECNMGAAGDMLMAALLELHGDPDGFLLRLNNIGIPNVAVSSEPSVKCGITGTHVKVNIGGQEEDTDTNIDNHSHDHKHEHEYTPDHGHEHTCDQDHTHSNEHDHGHEHAHNHDHKHDHDHGHEHTYGHDHAHNHDHTHNHAHIHGQNHTHDHDDIHDHHYDSHDHNTYHDIEHLISRLNISENIKKNAVQVYRLIAEAESHAHGVPVSQIHFHEVGTMDAVADIIGVCMLIEELAPDLILASPVNTGKGHVRCTHGILPVPAPAAAYILQNIPIYNEQTTGELCTPTGAALLKHFVSEFSKMPVMAVTKIGYGMGKKDFDKANCVRAFMGNVSDNDEEIIELVCNLDDMTAEAAAFAQQLLLDEGALDVYTVSIGMKKGRAGIMLTCMCRSDMKEKMLHLIFKHTTTLGIRVYTSRRYALQREQTEVQTEYGSVRVKASHGFGVKRLKPEYEDIAEIARREDKSIQDILREIEF